MSREDALKWIKLNWKMLVRTKKLDKALNRYAKKYFSEDLPAYKPDDTQEALDIFDGTL